jgi:hypothetical protein
MQGVPDPQAIIQSANQVLRIVRTQLRVSYTTRRIFNTCGKIAHNSLLAGSRRVLAALIFIEYQLVRIISLSRSVDSVCEPCVPALVAPAVTTLRVPAFILSYSHILVDPAPYSVAPTNYCSESNRMSIHRDESIDGGSKQV